MYIIIAIIKILVVRPSVTGGQQKRFDLEKQETVSLAIEQQRLQLGDLCERQSWVGLYGLCIVLYLYVYMYFGGRGEGIGWTSVMQLILAPNDTVLLMPIF